MAEFCLECWSKINNGKDDEKTTFYQKNWNYAKSVVNGSA